MPEQTELTARLEDYVESIYHISSRQGAARVTDIAADLDVTKSSVTGALRTLSSRGLVNYDPYSVITLTDEGEQIAKGVVRRHRILARFLEEVLGVDAEGAQANACRIEHAAEPRVVERLMKFVEFVEHCPRAGEQFTKGFARFFGGDKEGADCAQCLREVISGAEGTRGEAACGDIKKAGESHE